MKVYLLKRDFNHLVDMGHDIAIKPFEGYKSVGKKIRKKEVIDLPSELEFVANFNVVKSSSDYPIVDQDMPIMSIKMLDILKGVRDFNYRTYDTISTDDTYLKTLRDAEGKLLPEVPVIREFKLVQILDVIEALDYENSQYEPMNEWERFPTIIHKFVIKKPAKGFPPLFRIVEKPTAVFISEEAKEALEANDIKGCVFEQVEVS